METFTAVNCFKGDNGSEIKMFKNTGSYFFYTVERIFILYWNCLE